MPADERWIAVRRAARTAVHSLAEGDTEPTIRLRSIRELQRTLPGMERDEVATLRGTGHSWSEVRERTGDHNVFDLFERIAVLSGPSLMWRCESCGSHVSDYGPEAYSHPADTERGHADTCGRHNSAIYAYEQSRD